MKINEQSELEKRIYDYKIKELKAWRHRTYILEVNSKVICKCGNDLRLNHSPFPTEFTSAEAVKLKKQITGSVKVFCTREWYKEKLKALSVLLFIGKEDMI